MKKLLLLLLLLSPLALSAQVSSARVEPLACPIIGFNAGAVVPAAGPMNDLYRPPYLSFGVEGLYKFENNVLLSLEGNILMGADNLRNRTERMSNVFTRDSLIIGTGGSDADATCYNRALQAKVGMGYIIRLNSANPNSGLLLRLGAGFMTQKTIFMLNDDHAPQVEDPYTKLYDHRRAGLLMTQSVGYLFMSNHKNLLNCYVALEVSQLWSRSTRPYVIDDLMGLRGPDTGRNFDLLFSLKLCWMVPLTGKPAREFLF